MEREAEKTLQEFSIDQFFETEFFKGSKSDQMTTKVARFWSAIEFLSKHIKKDATVKNSDFIICFLEAFHNCFPGKLDLQNPSY